MIGWLSVGGTSNFVERTALYGVPILHVAVSKPWRKGEGRWVRQVRRGCKILVKGGCRRVLTEENFPYWQVLQAHNLRGVDPTPLCQWMAAPLALAALERQGISPQQATVLLVGERADQPLIGAAQTLCPQVRHLVTCVARGGESLGNYLREEYGVATLEEVGHLTPHVTLAFAPKSPIQNCGGVCMNLWRGGLDLGEYSISCPEKLPPEGVEPLALWSILWELGRISRAALEIIPTCSSINCLDRVVQTTYNI